MTKPRRLLVTALCVATLGIVCWPVVWKPGRDSFPLSSYPMFARSRTTSELRMEYIVGRDSDGKMVPLGPKLVANGEVLQAKVTIASAVARDGGRSLCRDIATRLAEAGDSSVVRVEVLRGRHDTIELLARGHRGSESLVTACRVKR